MTKKGASLIRKSAKPKPRSPVSADIEFGKRVKARRIKQNMSQQDLAAVLGVSFQQVQKYEKGTNRLNANRLVLIASALKMRPEDFSRYLRPNLCCERPILPIAPLDNELFSTIADVYSQHELNGRFNTQ